MYLYTEDYIIHKKYVLYKYLYAQHPSKQTFAHLCHPCPPLPSMPPSNLPTHRRKLPDFATQMFATLQLVTHSQTLSLTHTLLECASHTHPHTHTHTLL